MYVYLTKVAVSNQDKRIIEEVFWEEIGLLRVGQLQKTQEPSSLVRAFERPENYAPLK